MTKLLILSECPEAAAVDESATSWAVRELGARVAYFGTDDAAKVLVDERPECVVYRSTLNRERMLSDETLRWIGSRSRLVLWCSEASSPHYRDLLGHYRDEKLFAFRVGTDGGPQTDLLDWVTLWPVDPQWYAALDRYDHYKDITCGFAGSIGDERRPLLRSFGDTLTVRERKAGNDAEFADYAAYAAWTMRCRSVLNDATLDGGWAVKNRVIEAGLAGCLLFEQAESPLSRWGFEPGVDYLAYDAGNPGAVQAVLEMPEFPDIAATFGARLRDKVRQFHPTQFWQRVLDG